MNLVEQSLQIPAGGVALDADVAVPEPTGGVVLLAHGSAAAQRPGPLAAVVFTPDEPGFSRPKTKLRHPDRSCAKRNAAEGPAFAFD